MLAIRAVRYDLPPLHRIGDGKIDDEPHPPQKRRIQRALEVCGEDRQAELGLHPLQQLVDLEFRVAVVAVLYFGPLAE